MDMYSGFIYSMMGIPEDLFTPLFACARMAGWAAHRFEEIAAGKRIIRPAYKTPSAAPNPTSRSSVGKDCSQQGRFVTDGDRDLKSPERIGASVSSGRRR